MRQELSKILVTGGAGFIGSAFTKLAVKRGYRAIVLDKLTYAGDLERLNQVNGKYRFYKADICNSRAVQSVFAKAGPDAVVHFAAETHVDRSIQDPAPFLETNINGTQVVLDASRKYKIKKFIHISSDEVYGEIKKGKFAEDSPLRPNSPYAASKAAADLLIKAYIRTYDFPAVIVRPCNNYGPWQYPEKLIPVAILAALKDKKIPVYADGKNVREWLYVADCAEGILKILEKSKTGEIFNLGAGEEKRNIDVAKSILKILNKPLNLIEFVKDRPGHDYRYALNTGKMEAELGWQAKTGFEDGLEKTIKWYSGKGELQ